MSDIIKLLEKKREEAKLGGGKNGLTLNTLKAN